MKIKVMTINLEINIEICIINMNLSQNLKAFNFFINIVT